MQRGLWITGLLVAQLCGGWTIKTCGAEEPARAFLNGLRARGFQDTGLEYLDLLQESPLAPAAFKDTILYEKSLLLIDLSRSQRDPLERVKQLDQAQAWLQQFIATNGSSPKANAARSQLGSLLVERARMKSENAKKGDREKLEKESRALYEQSFVVFRELQAKVDEQLSAIPKVLNTRDRKEAQLLVRRKQLRADFLQTELFAAAIREELADQLPAGSTDQTEYLSQAAQMYEGIYKKYRTRLAGLYARMYQGRCNQRLGKTRDALGFFGELLDQPNEPETMLTLKAKVLRLAMETWLSPAEKKYMEAIKRGTKFFDEAPRGKEREPDWLAIRFSLAKAYKMQADDAKRTEPVDAQLIERSLQAAIQQLQFVASESGEDQEAAEKLLAQLGGQAIDSGESEFDTFDLAQNAAKEALDLIQPTTKAVQQLQRQIAAEKDTVEVAKLEKQLSNQKRKLDAAKDDAVKYYKLAIELADDATPQSSLNLARYFLCYVYFVRQDYWESALIGKFVAQRYPQSPGARQCAKIATACLLKLFDESEVDDQTFEIEQLSAMGRFLSESWPDSADTEASLVSIIPVLINAGEFFGAADLVSKIPVSSPQRSELEFVTGQSLWGAYLAADQQRRERQRSAVPDDVDSAASEERLTQLRDVAKKLLSDGVTRLPEQPLVSTSNATAMLSLAQLYLEDARFSDAITLLEHAVIGPLTLVQQSSDVVSNPIFIEETYRTALRSYVGSLGSGDEDAMEKAKLVMNQMQAQLGDDEGGKQRMLGVYVSLAQDVERGMKSAPPEARLRMSELFEKFLLELSAGSNDLSVLNWVAETFASLGTGLQDGTAADENAKTYFQQAATAFEGILGQQDLSPAMRTQTTARLASVTWKIGDREKAFKLYQEVLARNPSAINVQVTIAQLLQEWGSDDPAKYFDAIHGIKSNPQAPVWGWTKISLSAADNDQFRDTFFQARYELARCQFALALSKSGAEKDALLAAANKTLTRVGRLYPTLGGPESFDKYDAILKAVQTARNETASGLLGLGLSRPDLKSIGVKSPSEKSNTESTKQPPQLVQ